MLKTELEKNQTIKKVYNTEDNKKDFLNEILVFKSFTFDDYLDVFNALKENILFLKEYVVEDDSTSSNVLNINECIFDLANQFENTDEEARSFVDNRENRALLIPLQNMVVLYAATSTREKSINDFLKADSSELMLLRNHNNNKYYRGESDYGYKLLPSIYRNYNSKKYGNIFDYSVLFRLYNETNLINKYSTVFDYHEIDYDFCAYMQHSKAYSPFLDLTIEPLVGLSFATKSYGNLNNYMNSDAALYEFYFATTQTVDSKSTNVLKKHYTYVVDSRLRISSVVKKVLLCKCTYSIFSIDVYVFDEKVNDRMKYQKGSFLYINNSVIVNGIMLMPISMGKITKYKIPPKEKNMIYNLIKTHKSHYDYEHLMNPYMLFDDAPNL